MERISKENGQGLIEYGMILAFVSVATVASLVMLGTDVIGLHFSNLSSLLGVL